jgi:hypothetical protein
MFNPAATLASRNRAACSVIEFNDTSSSKAAMRRTNLRMLTAI